MDSTLNQAAYTLRIAIADNWIFFAAPAVFGLLFGSFLNVCVTRLPLGEQVSSPRSHCRACHRRLRWWEMVPVASWIALRGKCRTCGARIQARYAIVELALALLWMECYRRFGATPAVFCAAMLCFLLLGLAATDWETMLLPDAFTLSGLGVGLAAAFLRGTLTRPAAAFLGAALGAAILLLISGAYYLLRRRQGLGMGDVKLLAMIGAFLGPPQMLLAFFLGTVATAVAAIMWLLSKRFAPGWREHPLPYGTFLALAGIFSLFYGEQIVAWYANAFR